MVSLADDMRRVLAAHWRLNDQGYGVCPPCGPDERGFYWDPTDAEIEAERLKQREVMLEPHSLQTFAAARVWLRQWPKRKTFRIGSMWLKHAAEPEIGYSTEGVFIAPAVAIAEGFQIKADPWPICTAVSINIDRRAGRLSPVPWDGSYRRHIADADAFRAAPWKASEALP